MAVTVMMLKVFLKVLFRFEVELVVRKSFIRQVKSQNNRKFHRCPVSYSIRLYSPYNRNKTKLQDKITISFIIKIAIKEISKDNFIYSQRHR